MLCCRFSLGLWGVAERKRFFLLNLDFVLLGMLSSGDVLFVSRKVEERGKEGYMYLVLFV